MKVEWKALGWAWLAMLLTNALFGFLVDLAVEERQVQTLVTAGGTFAVGGYVAYRLAGERKGLHVVLAIVGYYLILVVLIVALAMLVGGRA